MEPAPRRFEANDMRQKDGAFLLQLRPPGVLGDNTSTNTVPLTMAETTGAESVRVNSSAGHLSVHVEGEHPVDIPFLFEQQQKRLEHTVVASVSSHVAMAVLALLLFHYRAALTTHVAIIPQQPLNDQIIWLSEPGPGGGGGGGGNRMKEPPRKAEDPGKDKITVPVRKPEVPKIAKNEPNPLDQLNIPAKPLAAATESLPGVLEAPPGPPTISQGPGSGGGSGTGTGTGIGPGFGSGLGDGSGGGTGGGIYRPGNGVSLPRLIHEVKPAYTADAMRAKIQGIVLLECVVRPDGSVTDIQVLRSLDPTFGLDQEAIKAARQWRFQPGTRMGQPVPVQVTIELTFTLR
jgi:TonB family protein